jgi:hypothetical protein
LPNDFDNPTAGQDRNLLVDWFSVTGPLGATGEPSPLRARLVICDPASAGDEPCLRTILAAFSKRAFRRPVTDAERGRLAAIGMTAIGEGQGFDAGLALSLQAVLVSPHFLYRIELDPDPRSLTPHPLSVYELASRLSYFLWSSMPA